MATFRTETPQAVAILKNLGEVLLNVGKAMFGLSTFSNSKMLLQALLPLSGVLASLSKNTGLVRIALYLYAATAAAGKLRPAMTALFGAGGEGGIIRGIGKAVTGIGNMTKAMLGLDAASNANVIGLVVIAIAALGAAFYVAWQKSAGFRDVIKDIGVVLLAAGILIVKYNKMIVDSFLSVIGTILHGLADAFGWIPGGVGNALRSASKSFDSFKAGTDRVLNGMIGTMQGWQNSLNASKITVAAATASIVANFHGQGAAARQSRTDVTNYTAAVLNNGNTSNAAQSARKQLITDLEHAGLSAQAANKLVNDLSAAIRSLPSKTVQIHMDGTGLYTITGSVIAASQGKGGSGNAAGGLAAGGRITGPGGPRSDTAGLFALSHGEWVIRADSAARYGLAAMDAVNQGKAVIGYASGGPVKGNLTPAYISGMYGTFQKDMTDAMVAAMRATMKTAVAAAKAAAAAAGGIGNYKPGAGVAQWASVISRALAMLGLSPGLLGAVEAQMASESGGNPYAINKRDSNWLAGHPSVGLMQVIRGTFQAYAGQFRNTGPFAYGVSENPLANVYAALNYGKHGAGFGTGPGQIGSMHGYASGTVGAAPGWAWVGERGPELVRFRGGEQVTPGDGLAGLAAELRALRAEVRQLTDVAAAIHARTGQHVAGAVGGTGADAAFRRRYPASR